MPSNLLLELRSCSVRYPVRTADGARHQVQAMTDVSLQIRPGETFGLVGESGCGKSTLARAAMMIRKPDSGSVVFDGVDLTPLGASQLRRLRSQFQMVFQDPYASLDPRMTVADAISEPLRVHRIGTIKSRRTRVHELLSMVGLPSSVATKRPVAFSGGQRQRIGIARALALRPKLLVADEPVSALDVSVQAQILNLLMDLKRDLGIGMLFISHDLSVVEHISDRVGVMYLGRIMEQGNAQEIFMNPAHPYTNALLAAIPQHGQQSGAFVRLKGEIPSPADPPPGCLFHTRCPAAEVLCSRVTPSTQILTNTHQAACHRLTAKMSRLSLTSSNMDGSLE